jgi:hypothetical protein
MKIRIVVALAFLSSPLHLAVAQGLQVDQGWVPPWGGGSGGLHIGFFGPLGQEFTPSLNGLNAVDLFIEDWNYRLNAGAEFQVRIRNDEITGPIVGTSESVSLPDGFSGTVKFEFPSLVPVLPGSRYVMELHPLQPLSGENNWGTASKFDLEGGYPGGAVIKSGSRADQEDMVFMEGIIVDRDLWLKETLFIPEPSSTTLSLSVAVAAVLAQLVARVLHKRA